MGPTLTFTYVFPISLPGGGTNAMFQNVTFANFSGFSSFQALYKYVKPRAFQLEVVLNDNSSAGSQASLVPLNAYQETAPSSSLAYTAIVSDPYSISVTNSGIGNRTKPRMFPKCEVKYATEDSSNVCFTAYIGRSGTSVYAYTMIVYSVFAFSGRKSG